MQKITKEHRNLVFFFFFFLPNSISMEVDGREESRNVGIVREGVESNRRYRPSRVPTHSGPPSRHRKLHAADNFARRGRYIGVITIITLLAVFSPWFFAEPYGKLHYIYIFLFFFLRVHEVVRFAPRKFSCGRDVSVGSGIGERNACNFVPFSIAIETRVVDFTRYDRSSVCGMWKKAR